MFFSNTHTYLIRGRQSLGSVTGLIGACCTPFNVDQMIKRMQSSRSWPRPNYLQPSVPWEVLNAIGDFPSALELHSLLMLREEQPLYARAELETQICNLCAVLKTVHEKLIPHIDALALTSSQIITKWENNRDIAARQGTLMHYSCEAFLNNVRIPERIESSTEFKLFRKFLSIMQNLTAYRTEWVIFGDEERLAGSVDFVAIEECGDLVIVDWKRSKGMKTTSSLSYGKMMLGPCHSVPDSWPAYSKPTGIV